MPDTLDWTGALSALLEFQGHEVMVQVGDRREGRLPVLSAFGVLLGGPQDDRGPGGGIVTLELADPEEGSNGALVLRPDDFESAERRSERQLVIHYSGMEVVLERAGDEPAELGPNAGGGLTLLPLDEEDDEGVEEEPDPV